MAGRAPRDKGKRGELIVVHVLQEAGITAQRVPNSGSSGGKFSGDVSAPLFGADRTLEVKTRAKGFDRLYGWLGTNDGLVVRQDRCDALLIVRLSDAARWSREYAQWENAAGQSFVRAERLEDAADKARLAKRDAA